MTHDKSNHRLKAMGIRRFCALAGVMALASTASGATPFVPVHYDVQGSFAHGCFEPCLCPISFTDEVTGSFTLTAGFGMVVADGVFSLQPFDVENVIIIVNTSVDGATTYTGSGSYQLINGEDGILRHQLVVDLTTDGKLFTTYDSGLIPVETTFPDVDIAISINGMFCLDSVFWIDASPSAIAGDINGDGAVNGLDLGFLLAAWSIPPGSPGCPGWALPAPCPADLNGDGVVDGLDLGILLSHWTV